MILLILACASEWSGDACAKHTDDPDALGYCVSTSATSLDRAAAEKRCARVPAWEDDCRSRWIAARLREIGGPPAPSGLGLLAEDDASIVAADALVDFCHDDDCRFLVIDRFRDADLLNQLRRCEGVGTYVGDCMAHASESWRRRVLTDEELATVRAALPTIPPEGRTRASIALGWAMACREPQGDPIARCFGSEAWNCREGWRLAVAQGCPPASEARIGQPR